MPVGQQVLSSGVLDVAEVDRLGGRLEARERDRSRLLAEQLIDALAFRRTYDAAGMALGAAAELALLLSCSENRANGLLSDAQVLQQLDALSDLRDGLLTVEQARVVIDLLGVLDTALAAGLWQRLRGRLIADRSNGIPRPPARLREVLTRWILTADPDGAAARRKAVQDDADVELWSRDGGSVDLAVRGLDPVTAQACLTRIEERAEPLGEADGRTAGQRRRDAFTDLVLGREVLPFGEPPAAPAGVQVFGHVPLATALGASDEPAELVGHGPIERAVLADVLAAGPVLHRVWVEPATGVPVVVDPQTWRTVEDLATGPPPDTRHPSSPADRHPHPTGPGPYRPTRSQRRLLRVRAPRCEWPGCGRRSTLPTGTDCDHDHDLAWPFGPTCPCNLGPLCRRHHRIKQLGWTKQRRPDGSIRWTSPTRRTWTSPPQGFGNRYR